jgi:molybdopterin/thiamine biosynthesis adenylyltransferase/rhodanese-related sulfurtransferase/molybdopterin converting factor small subunit
MQIHIPAPLRVYTAQQETVAVEGHTVDEALGALCGQYPELKKHLFTADNKLRSFVNLYLNDEDIRYLEGVQTPVKDVDALSIIPSIAGGAASLEAVAEESSKSESKAGELPELSNAEMARYSRHLILPEVGMEGQRKLKAARVLCIGTGGLGSPLALYLTAAGVGTLGLVDFDKVDESNLQRQIIHATPDIGRPKIDSAAEKLKALNPFVNVVKHETMLTSENALELFADYDIIVDGTDNFPTRYLVNDACVITGKPNVYGSIFRFDGQASVFATKDGPCYRCLYPEPPPPGLVPSCAEGGVLGILPGLVGVIQATEAIKLILGAPEPLIGRLLLVDAWRMKFRELKLRKNPECPVCGTHPTVTKLIDYQQFCGFGGEEKVTTINQMPVEELKRRLDAGDDVVVLDVREPHEFQIANLTGTKPDVKFIPLGQVGQRLGELEEYKDREIVVHCKMGGRSQKAAEQLQAAGFTKLHNLAGGITAWSEKIDPKVAKY